MPKIKPWGGVPKHRAKKINHKNIVNGKNLDINKEKIICIVSRNLIGKILQIQLGRDRLLH